MNWQAAGIFLLIAGMVGRFLYDMLRTKDLKNLYMKIDNNHDIILQSMTAFKDTCGIHRLNLNEKIINNEKDINLVGKKIDIHIQDRKLHTGV